MMELVFGCLVATWFIMKDPLTLFIIWVFGVLPIVLQALGGLSIEKAKKRLIVAVVYMIVCFIISVLMH